MYLLKNGVSQAGALLLTVVSGWLYAQQPNFSAGSLLSQSTVTQWTGDNGLVSNNITSAIRDQRGFVWITSYNGIMRFDGIQVYVYDETKIPFLVTGAFYAVYEQKPGVLWFSSQNSGVVRFQNGKFESIDPQNEVLPKSIRCLRFGKDSTIWVGTNNAGLYKIEGKKFHRIDLSELNETSILEMSIDHNNVLWIATDGKGLYRYDGSTLENIPGVANPIVNSVFVAGDNSVLIGTPGGLDIYKNGIITHYPKLINFQVNKVICDQSNRVWVGTELGLAKFILGDDESFAYVGEKEGFPLSRINFLFHDEENSLWVSTGRDGLVQLRETNIVNISAQQGLSQSKINMVYEGPNRDFYVGSDGGRVDIYKHGKITPIQLQTPLFDSGIRDIYQKDGTLWIASYRGLLKKTPTSEHLYDAKDGFTAIDLRRILPAENGDLWIASRSGGLMRFHDGKIIKKFTKENGLQSNYILALENDKQGNIYLGTHSGGMSLISKDGQVKNFSLTTNDAGIVVFNIHIDGTNKVWVVSSAGLFHFNGKGFQKLALTKSLKGEVFFDWVEDKLGNAWITSNLGVLKIRKKDIESYLRNEISEISFKLIDNRDGMKNKECTAATRALLSSSGKIWVPTINGISVFYPEKTIENKTPPPVYLTSLLVDNEELELNGPLTIGPGKLRYTFSYTAPSFISPKKIQFKYRLEDVDDKWIDANTERQAEYTNLAPGKYTFRVLACNNDGVWNEEGASITFVVKPFFYQTAYFYVLMVVVLLLLFYGVYKWRVNAIEKRNEELRKVNGELDRFVYSASHDLRAPLASVLGLVNVARIEKGKDFEGYLDKIEASVQKLDGFIRDIIDFSRNARMDVASERIDFQSLINEVFDNLKYLDENDRIKRLVNVEGTGDFYSDKKRLTVILNNLIANSIKYSNPHEKNPFIEVYVNQNSRQALLQVKDNGIGIGREHISSIFKMFYRADSKSKGSGIGLYIVKETLDKIRGSISVQSEYGKGSTFTVILKSIRTNSSTEVKQAEVKIENRDLKLASQTKPDEM